MLIVIGRESRVPWQMLLRAQLRFDINFYATGPEKLWKEKMRL